MNNDLFAIHPEGMFPAVMKEFAALKIQIQRDLKRRISNCPDLTVFRCKLGESKRLTELRFVDAVHLQLLLTSFHENCSKQDLLTSIETCRKFENLIKILKLKEVRYFVGKITGNIEIRLRLHKDCNMEYKKFFTEEKVFKSVRRSIERQCDGNWKFFDEESAIELNTVSGSKKPVVITVFIRSNPMRLRIGLNLVEGLSSRSFLYRPQLEGIMCAEMIRMCALQRGILLDLNCDDGAIVLEAASHSNLELLSIGVCHSVADYRTCSSNRVMFCQRFAENNHYRMKFFYENFDYESQLPNQLSVIVVTNIPSTIDDVSIIKRVDRVCRYLLNQKFVNRAILLYPSVKSFLILERITQSDLFRKKIKAEYVMKDGQKLTLLIFYKITPPVPLVENNP